MHDRDNSDIKLVEVQAVYISFCYQRFFLSLFDFREQRASFDAHYTPSELPHLICIMPAVLHNQKFIYNFFQFHTVMYRIYILYIFFFKLRFGTVSAFVCEKYTELHLDNGGCMYRHFQTDINDACPYNHAFSPYLYDNIIFCVMEP